MTPATPSSLKSLSVASNLVSFTLIVAILYLAKVVLVPVALAIMLAFVLNPVVTRLHAWGFGRLPSVITTIVLAALLIGSLFAVVTVQINHLANDLPKYEQNIRSKITSLRAGGKGGALDKIQSTIQAVAKDPDAPGAKDSLDGRSNGEPIATRIVSDESALTRALGPLRSLGPAIEWLANAFLVLILTIFMLIRREDLRNRLVSFASKGSLSMATKALNEAGQRISRYMVMQLIINGTFGFAVGVGLFFIGIPYAPLWGLCAIVLRYIPYVGAWLAAAAPLAVSFVTFPGWTAMLLVFGLFLVLELITGNVMEPWLYGQGTGVSEVALLICATFWAWIWGPVGLILATPLTVCLVVSGKYVTPLAFLDRLLGDRPVLKPHIAYLQRLLARDAAEAAAVVREYRSQNAPETVFDNLFVPALFLARQDRVSGSMAAEDESFVFEKMSENIAALLPSGVQSGDDNPAAEADADSGPPRLLIYGFPAHHEVDELTLRMLEKLIVPHNFSMTVFSRRSLPSVMLEQVRLERPRLVFIAALPPGGLPQACFLCESLRESFPELGIVVGYWGLDANLDETIVNLRSAGANYVTTTLLGAVSHILSVDSLPMPLATQAAHSSEHPVIKT